MSPARLPRPLATSTAHVPHAPPPVRLAAAAKMRQQQRHGCMAAGLSPPLAQTHGGPAASYAVGATDASGMTHRTANIFKHQAMDVADEEAIRNRATVATSLKSALKPTPIFNAPVDGNWCAALAIAGRVCVHRMTLSLQSTHEPAKRVRCEEESQTPEELADIQAAEAKAAERARMYELRRLRAMGIPNPNAAPKKSDTTAEEVASAAQRRCLAAARRVRDKEEEAAIKQRVHRGATRQLLERELQPHVAAEDAQPTLRKLDDDDRLSKVVVVVDGSLNEEIVAETKSTTDPAPTSAALTASSPTAPAPTARAPTAPAPAAQTPTGPPPAPTPERDTRDSTVEVARAQAVSVAAAQVQEAEDDEEVSRAVGGKSAPHDEEEMRGDGRPRLMHNQPPRDLSQLAPTAMHAGGLTGRSAFTESSLATRRGGGSRTARDPSETLRWAGSLTSREDIGTSREERIELSEIERAFKLAAAMEVIGHIDAIEADTAREAAP